MFRSLNHWIVIPKHVEPSDNQSTEDIRGKEVRQRRKNCAIMAPLCGTRLKTFRRTLNLGERWAAPRPCARSNIKGKRPLLMFLKVNIFLAAHKHTKRYVNNMFKNKAYIKCKRVTKTWIALKMWKP
jgi:hypothetical protein